MLCGVENYVFKAIKKYIIPLTMAFKIKLVTL